MGIITGAIGPGYDPHFVCHSEKAVAQRYEGVARDMHTSPQGNGVRLATAPRLV